MRNAVTLVLLVALAGCSRITVQSDYDPAAPFASYRSFAWRSLPDTITKRTAETTANEMLVNSPRLNDRITSSIEQELESRGIHQTVGDSADLHVAYFLSVSRKSEVSQWYSNAGQPYDGWHPGNEGYGYDQWKEGPETSVTNTNYSQSLQGTLIIDLVDARTNTMVWRGMGSRTIDSDQPGKNAPEGIKKIMKSFPPH